MIGFGEIARIYHSLTENINVVAVGSEETTFPRGAKRLAAILSDYSLHTFTVEKIDFHNVEGLDHEILALKPDDHDLFSIVVIGERPIDPHKVNIRRPVKIILNSGIQAGKPALNECWGRFCLVKEACQAVLFEEIPKFGISYPHSMTFDDISTLFSRINTQPFSLWDFNDEDYAEGLKVENAAELLACGLLFPFERALEMQRQLIKDRGEVGIRTFNFLGIATDHKVPERYVEVILTWGELAGFVAEIERARRGL